MFFFKTQNKKSQEFSHLGEGQADISQMESFWGIFRLGEVEMLHKGFRQQQEVGFSNLASTSWEISEEFSDW